MRLLFLGNSDTLGAGLEHLEDSYPQLVLRALQEALPGQEHEVTVHALMPTPTAADWAEKVCRQVVPDVVVLRLTGYQVLATVDARIHRLFPRLYPYYARLRDLLATTLNAPGRAHWQQQLYSALRSLLRGIVGAEPPVSSETTAEIYCAIVRRLAALETLSVIVMTISILHSQTLQQHPGARRNIDLLYDLIRACGQRTHVSFLDVAGPSDGSDDALFQPDALHGNEAGHRQKADLLLPHLLALDPSSAAKAKT